MIAKEYLALGEDWCVDNADYIDWDVFEYHADKFSMKFGELFKYEIKHWYINGVLHRENGPATEWVDGKIEWYLNGKEFTKEQFDRLDKYPGMFRVMLTT